jgi:hypothetical protein
VWKPQHMKWPKEPTNLLLKSRNKVQPLRYIISTSAVYNSNLVRTKTQTLITNR